MDWLLEKTLNLSALAVGLVSTTVLAIGDLNGLEKFLSTFGVMAALVWFMYHTVKFTIPRLVAEGQQHNERVAQGFKDSLKETLTEERSHREKMELQHTQQLREACKYRGES